MTKGGYNHQKELKSGMNCHVAAYYTHLMNSVDTGCPMMDYCMKDIFVYDILRNMV